VATLETTANRPRNGGFRGWPLKAKNRGTLLFRALGGLWDKGQHGGRLVKLSDKVVTFSFVFYGDGRSGLWGELLDRLESVHKLRHTFFRGKGEGVADDSN
jgi:hypothetical protein